MNGKQRRFAEEYAVDHNATAAAVRAGYAERSAKQLGQVMDPQPDPGSTLASLCVTGVPARQILKTSQDDPAAYIVA